MNNAETTPQKSTEKPVALVTAPVRGPGLDILANLAQLVIDPWIDEHHLRIYNSEQLAERVDATGASIVVVEADSCKDPLFTRDLLAVAACRGTPTNVDVEAATRAGVPVLRAPGRNANAVAELTIGLLIAATRGIVPADRDVRQGQVYAGGRIPYQRFRGWELAGKTAGIVGLGAIGRALKWRLEGLGLKVISTDPYSSEATHSLDDLLAEADIVSLHVPMTPETFNMIDRPQFQAMKEGAVFINAARAALHNMDALVEALSSGKLAAAALDHFEGETLPVDHPLCQMDNVVLTPHIGGATFDTEANHTWMVAKDLELLLSGKPPVNIVNPEVLEGKAASAPRA